MRRVAGALLVLVLAATVSADQRPRPERPVVSPARAQAVWVYFKDKGPAAEAMSLAAGTINPRALARRAARGTQKGVTFEDAPMRHEYVAAVGALAGRARNVSRWLNAMSVEAT